MATVFSGDFEWDEAKAVSNKAKHGVTFEEAAVALASDPHEVAYQDLAKPDRKKPHDVRPELDLSRPGLKPVTRLRKGAERVTLRTLREAVGKTQMEMAHVLETDQGEVSRIDRRPDVLLSTLRKYSAALGAHCEVALVFADGRRVLLAEPEPAEPSPK